MKEASDIVGGVGTHELIGDEKIERLQGCSLLFMG